MFIVYLFYFILLIHLRPGPVVAGVQELWLWHGERKTRGRRCVFLVFGPARYVCVCVCV